MGNYFLWKRDFLAHHGIKGQKWGIRRYQNEDGSLTPEGRERYGITDDKYDANRILNDSEYSKNVYRKYSQMFNDQANLAAEKFDELTISREKDYKDFYNNKDLAVQKGIEYLKSINSDEDFLEDDVDDFLNYNVPMSKKSKELESSFSQASNDYYSAAEKLTNHLIGELKNQEITSTKYKLVTKNRGIFTTVKQIPYEEKVNAGKKVINDILSTDNNFNSSYMHYLRNHTEAALTPYLDKIEPADVKKKRLEIKREIIKEYSKTQK